MRFDQALRMSSRLVALSGLLAVLLSREAADWLLLPAALLTVAGILVPALSRPLLSDRTIAVGTVGATVLSVLDFFYLSGSLILAGTHLLTVLLCLKLLSLAADKDHIQLYAVSFFLLLASTGLSTEVTFLAAFLLFFISLTWSLILVTIKGEAGEASVAVGRWKVGRLFFGGTALLTLLSTVFTLAIFLVIPRVGVGLFAKEPGGILKVSGFSDKVDLGKMGEVLQDPTTVMRVELPRVSGRPSGQLYWRGRSFDHYDGSVWVDSISNKVPIYRTFDGKFMLGRAKGQVIEQSITMEPTETTNLFGVYPPVELSADFRNIYIDQSQAIYLTARPEGRFRYELLSEVRALPETSLRAQGPADPPGFAKEYLQLPDATRSAVYPLAARITSGEPGPYGKARKVVDYLTGGGYKYTLNPPRDTLYGPDEDFLLHSKAGYCGHFASAMVTMLRSVGVPSRMVSGYVDGVWNAYGNYMLVREKDAHTWVEVYVKRFGWVEFDPTPSSARGEGFFDAFEKASDYIRYRWDRYIVFFSVRDQASAVKNISGTVIRWRELLGRPGSLLERYLAPDSDRAKKADYVLFILPVLALAGVLAMVFMYRRRAARRPSGPSGFYGELIRYLKKRGHVRRSGVTPMEFAVETEAVDERLAGVTDVTEAYNRVRFGPGLSRAELDEARTVVDRLKNMPG